MRSGTYLNGQLARNARLFRVVRLRRGEGADGRLNDQARG